MEAIDVGALGTMDLSDAGEFFRSYLRGEVRKMFINVMAQEVVGLCGPAYHPNESEQFRAGTADGMVLYEGKRMDVKRPRVRRKKKDGSTEEVNLATYSAAQDPGQLERNIVEALMAGVASREQKRLHGKGTRRTSRSTVSRLWQREGAKKLEQFRARDLGAEAWLTLMIDGISLGGDLLAVVGLGITHDGRKMLLDFEIGSSESYVVCEALCRRIKTRGFGPVDGYCLFAVTDGAPALKKAILRVFEGTQIQRCLVHKERNLKGYLSKRDWGELGGLFKRLRQAEGEEVGREALGDLHRFVKSKNASAVASLEEAGDDLIRMHILGVPSTLATTLLSTNAIENSFRNVRSKMERVTRWRPDSDQPPRWLAYALTEAESGFRRVRGYQHLGALKSALALPQRPLFDEQAEAGRPAGVPPLQTTPCGPSPRPSAGAEG